jgi:hypothetical protein
MCRLSRNSGASNSWNPQGPVQACSGKALPFTTISEHPEKLESVLGIYKFNLITNAIYMYISTMVGELLPSKQKRVGVLREIIFMLIVKKTV